MLARLPALRRSYREALRIANEHRRSNLSRRHPTLKFSHERTSESAVSSNSGQVYGNRYKILWIVEATEEWLLEEPSADIAVAVDIRQSAASLAERCVMTKFI
jgi:hypothetical protein